MSTLLILLPPRERLQAGARIARPGATARALEFDWVLQRGDTLEQGRSPAAALPKAEQLVLQPHVLDCSFHRATLPRAPAARWRAALAGLLEEQLLEEPEQLHFALPPGAAPGEELWVCVSARAPLEQAVAALEAAQRFVDRIVPPAVPTDPPRAHVLADEQGAPLLLLAQAEGLLLRPLRGPLPQLPAGTPCSAEPELAAAAAAQLGARAKHCRCAAAPSSRSMRWPRAGICASSSCARASRACSASTRPCTASCNRPGGRCASACWPCWGCSWSA